MTPQEQLIKTIKEKEHRSFYREVDGFMVYQNRETVPIATIGQPRSKIIGIAISAASPQNAISPPITAFCDNIPAAVTRFGPSRWSVSAPFL